MLKPGFGVTTEEALLVSLCLWSYDFFFGTQSHYFIHLSAAVKLFQALDRGDDTSWSASLTPENRRTMVEAARSFFGGVKFPIQHSTFLKMLENQAKLNIGDHASTGDSLALPLPNPFTNIATPEDIDSFLWLTQMATSEQELKTIQQALDDCSNDHGNGDPPRSVEQEIFTNKIRLFSLVCEVALHRLNNRERAQTEQTRLEILGLIRTNTILTNGNLAAANDDKLPRLAVTLGILGIIAQQTQKHSTKLQAIQQMYTYGV